MLVFAYSGADVATFHLNFQRRAGTFSGSFSKSTDRLHAILVEY